MTVETRELRMQIPVTLAAALDGMALGRSVTKTDLVIGILQTEVDKALHEATILLRFARSNGDGRSPSE